MSGRLNWLAADREERRREREAEEAREWECPTCGRTLALVVKDGKCRDVCYFCRDNEEAKEEE